jgi:hypothetical protein
MNKEQTLRILKLLSGLEKYEDELWVIIGST